MLKVNQRYGKISWQDAYPLHLYGVMLNTSGELKESSHQFELGFIHTSKPGWHNHKSCQHLKVDATVDFGLPPTSDPSTGLIETEGRYLVDEGEIRHQVHFREPVADYGFAGDLDDAVHAQIVTLNDGQKLYVQLQCVHSQFRGMKHFWYPVGLEFGYLFASGNGSDYDYKRAMAPIKSWSHTQSSIRKASLDQIPEWNMSIDELLTTYGSGTLASYCLTYANDKYADVVHNQTYVGQHMVFNSHSYEVAYKSLPISSSYIKDYMEKWVYPEFGPIPQPSISNWGDLCHVAIQSGNMDANSWTLYSDLKEVGSEILSYTKFLRKPNLKNLSGAYLNTKYGTRLTVRDIKEYGNRLQSLIDDYKSVYQGFDIYSARQSIDPAENSGWSGYDSINCYASIKDSMTDIVIHSLQETGIGRLSNAWDIVPFTFVVDWFLDVGSLFEELDYRWNAATLAVHDVIRTVKRSKTLQIDNFLGSGRATDVTMTYYSRSCGNKLSYPSLGIASSDVYQNHVLDLSMIGLQLLS